MDFKEALADDLDTFINVDEWANLHNINGQEVPAVINTSNRQHIQLATVAGVFTSTLEVFVKQGSLDPLPTADNIVTLDGLKYYCYDVAQQQGIDVLKLYAQRG